MPAGPNRLSRLQPGTPHGPDLGGLAVGLDAHVGQHLLLQDLPGILNALGLCDAHCAATLAYVVQGELQSGAGRCLCV